MMILQKKLTLGVLHTHAVAGILGGILTGLLAEPKLARLFYPVDDWQHFIGFFYGLKSGRSATARRSATVCGLLEDLDHELDLFLDKAGGATEKGDESVHGEEAYALHGDGERPDNHKQVNNYLICYRYKFRVQIIMLHQI
ncbi:Ammonium transporter 3 member 2 [Sesamum angolense]|uniref:Ammonium transporter 3 member 2 n=1 Tax=Sesamum angolense TaxID=2727404 RepID=A0AAE1T5Q8_9LAMI|nr:Ammonium transporter 3 member 2 [Sesamum angolense]